MSKRAGRTLLMLVAAVVAVAVIAGVAAAQSKGSSFKMVRSESASAIDDCMEDASANVSVETVGVNQVMRISARGMPKKTLFTLFVIQQPDAPFGAVWYQGDLKTDRTGKGQVTVKGIFSDETFAFAPGSVPAPQLDDGDAANNPTFDPVHALHLGLWFASSEGAARAGCGAKVTPFDGDHEAGIQALSTRNFPDPEGPLGGTE